MSLTWPPELVIGAEPATPARKRHMMTVCKKERRGDKLTYLLQYLSFKPVYFLRVHLPDEIINKVHMCIRTRFAN